MRLATAEIIIMLTPSVELVIFTMDWSHDSPVLDFAFWCLDFRALGAGDSASSCLLEAERV